MSSNANIVIAQALMMRIRDYAERALDKKDVRNLKKSQFQVQAMTFAFPAVLAGRL